MGSLCLGGVSGDPVADRRDDFLCSVLLDEVTGAFQAYGAMAGEGFLPTCPVDISKGQVVAWPQYQGRTVAQGGKPALDSLKEFLAMYYLAG